MKIENLINDIKTYNSLKDKGNYTVRERNILESIKNTINIKLLSLTNFIIDNDYKIYKIDLVNLNKAEKEDNLLLYINVLYNIILKNSRVHYKALNKSI